jgi:hypothetical protein
MAYGFKKRLYRNTTFWLGITYLALTGGGGCNILTSVSNQTSDEALINNAENEMNQYQWTAAITTLQSLTPTSLASRPVQNLLASAYAGRGGLDVLSLAQKLQNMGSTSLFTFLMQSFTGSTMANFNDEVTAEGIMQGISVTSVGRTVDENVFMTFLELAKLGTLTAATADTDNDGIVDATFDSCTLAADGPQFVTGLANFLDSLGGAGLTVGGSSITTIQTDCAMLGTACSDYTVASVSAGDVTLILTLVGETNLGVGLAPPIQTGKCEFQGPYSGNCDGGATHFCP